MECGQRKQEGREGGKGIDRADKQGREKKRQQEKVRIML